METYILLVVIFLFGAILVKSYSPTHDISYSARLIQSSKFNAQLKLGDSPSSYDDHLCPNSVAKIKTAKVSHMVNQILKVATYVGIGGAPLVLTSPSHAATSPNGPYIDSYNKFEILIPEGWTIIPKVFPTGTPLSKYHSEEVLLVASIFVESAALSVTRSYAQTLLKDFDVEWWFAPFTTMADVGPADLIARLLILQRQGEFEKRASASEFIGAKMSEDGQSVDFEFLTIIAAGVKRKTKAKVLFRKGFLYVLWISGLESVFDGDYNEKLLDIANSFNLNA